jgi:uroporphyrinogen III methyltransferase/synthase
VPATKPLLGRRVLVTRPAAQASDLIRRLRELGAEPIICPTIRILPPDDFGPLDAAIRRLHQYNWLIFTSVNGVRFFFQRLQVLGSKDALAGVRLAAIGPATADALAAQGLPVHFMPREYVAEAIVEGIGDVTDQRILLPRADIARKALANGLRAKGAVVNEVTAYRTVLASPEDLMTLLGQEGEIDIATFTSPSTVRNFALLLGDRSPGEALGNAVIACIGPITARAAQAMGLAVDIVAEKHTVEGLVEAIVEYCVPRIP